MNRFDALRYFCTLAETLNFRDAATRLAISPPMVSKVINELEEQLGEKLFRRNTRTTQLTQFGEQFLPQALALLNESDRLFSLAKQQELEMQGVVRITSLELSKKHEIIVALLDELRDYPDLVIEWNSDNNKLETTHERIDIGIRLSYEMNPNFIVRPICQTNMVIVASPDLIARFGEPKDLADLKRRFPIATPLNTATGKPWSILTQTEQHSTAQRNRLIVNDELAILPTVLAGHFVAQMPDIQCKQLISKGELQVLLPDLPQPQWQLYLYRPYKTMTSKRELLVFEKLTTILKRFYAEAQ